jgi:hypothetical protein
MDSNLSNLLYGAIGGGLVAATFKILESYVIAPFVGESLEARKKLYFYAKPFWLDCYQLEYRLTRINDKDIGYNRHYEGLLTASLQDAKSVSWFVAEGYCVTSTAYLIASVAAWIVLVERDVAFLQFRSKSLTIKFFHLTQNLRSTISRSFTIWHYYVTGIGEKLIREGESKPMTFSDFIYSLQGDESNFRVFYSSLFQSINEISSTSNCEDKIRLVRKQLSEVRSFLETNKIVPQDLAFRRM